MSLVTFLGIYFVREAGIDLATVGVAFLCENLLRGVARAAVRRAVRPHRPARRC